MDTRTLKTAEADIVYNVEGPSPTADGRPPLFMIGRLRPQAARCPHQGQLTTMSCDITVVERRGFEPLTSAVRGRGYKFEYEAGRECPFD